MIADSFGRTKTLSATCSVCGCDYSIRVNPDHIMQWQCGIGYIQDIMPYLTSGERELLISKTCGSCFDLMFDLDDED